MENSTAAGQAGPSACIANFAETTNYEDIPESVKERARIHILDGLGLAIASTTFPFAGPTLAAVKALSSGSDKCSVIGQSFQATPRDAAMANGVLIHGLDYDDTHLQAIVHPTSAVLPTVLALGEAEKITGKAAMTAFCIGMEVAIRLGAAVKGGFHHTGFHATGVLAHFSSAVAAGKIKNANKADYVNAIGIAASTASGIQVFLEEGAWTKRLHPGWAAAGGITAATFAEHGFLGPSRAFEGRFGLFDTHLHTHAKNVDQSYLTEGLGKNWMMDDTALKPYPVCHFIHGAADAALELHPKLAGKEISSIDIMLPDDTLKIVAEPIDQKRNASNEYEAKFSAPFVVASTLLNGRFGLADLTEEAIANEKVQALASRCTCHADPNSLFPEYFSGGVRVTTTDGEVFEKHQPINSGAGEKKMTMDEAYEKFHQNAALAITREQAETIVQSVKAFDDVTISELMENLRT